ncbi:MAG: hypothetical protein AB1634_10430 [Thermodesulfobacteriota bacterium]
MRIVDSALDLSSRHQELAMEERASGLRVAGSMAAGTGTGDRLTLTRRGFGQLATATRIYGRYRSQVTTAAGDSSQLLERASETRSRRQAFVAKEESLAPNPPAPAPRRPGPPPFWTARLGGRRQETGFHYEYEETKLTANGALVTGDGRQISFQVDLALERQFALSWRSETLLATQQLTDPLVVNLSAASASLSQERVAFDLNQDGQSEEIAFVAAGSGFLALDRNGDGVINDGGELFGTASGNGFADLAVHDADGNGWLDENDPVFGSLVVWTRTAGGQDQLSSLQDLGLGAVHLTGWQTPFDLKDEGNALLGRLRRTGIGVMEDGSVISLQQVDLALGAETGTPALPFAAAELAAGSPEPAPPPADPATPLVAVAAALQDRLQASQPPKPVQGADLFEDPGEKKPESHLEYLFEKLRESAEELAKISHRRPRQSMRA